MKHVKLSINQTGNGDPPPKKGPVPTPLRVPADPVEDADIKPKKPKK